MATAQKPPRCYRRKPHRNMTRGGGLSCRRERSLSSTMMSSLVDVSFIHRRHGSPKGLGALRRCRLVRSALRAPERRTAITSSPSRERGGLHVTGITSSRRLQGARRRKDDSRRRAGCVSLAFPPSRPHSLLSAYHFPLGCEEGSLWQIESCRSTLAVNICLPPCYLSPRKRIPVSDLCFLAPAFPWGPFATSTHTALFSSGDYKKAVAWSRKVCAARQCPCAVRSDPEDLLPLLKTPR